MNTLQINIKAWKPKNSKHAQQLRRALKHKNYKREDLEYYLINAKAHRDSYNSYSPMWKLND